MPRSRKGEWGSPGRRPPGHREEPARGQAIRTRPVGSGLPRSNFAVTTKGRTARAFLPEAAHHPYATSAIASAATRLPIRTL